jgi:hypothetical protein
MPASAAADVPPSPKNTSIHGLLSQRGPFVHRDVVSLIALDLILRLTFANAVVYPL